MSIYPAKNHPKYPLSHIPYMKQAFLFIIFSDEVGKDAIIYLPLLLFEGFTAYQHIHFNRCLPR
jgi:hypothetical protein